MYSASDKRRIYALIVLSVAAGAGCRGQEFSTAGGTASATPSPIQFAVGPIPGASAAPVHAPNPYGNESTLLEQGRELFVTMNCSGCHGGHAGGGMGPSLRDVDWIYGGAEANIFSSIAEGRANGMPAWGTRLPDQSMWALVAYIKSLRTPREPDPPS
jgi:cytochrome c oxidase cbb3-type subunit 3